MGRAATRPHYFRSSAPAAAAIVLTLLGAPATAMAIDRDAEINELTQWYSSVCQVEHPDETTATITDSLINRIDKARKGVRGDVNAAASQVEDPELGVDRERGLMKAAISETRADYNGAIHELARMSVTGASAEAQANQRIKVRWIKARKQNLELHYAVGDYLEGVRGQGVQLTAERVSKLREQANALDHLYADTRSCNSIAKGNINDTDFTTGESLGVNQVVDPGTGGGGGGFGNASGGSGR